MAKLSEEELVKLSEKVSELLHEDVKDRISTNEKERGKLLADLKKKDPSNYYSWLKHPLLLIVSGFLFTGILGGLLNFHIQQQQVEKQYEITRDKEVVKDAIQSLITFSDDSQKYLSLSSEFYEMYNDIQVKDTVRALSKKEDSLLGANLRIQYTKMRNAKFEIFKNAALLKTKYSIYFSKNDSITRFLAKADRKVNLVDLVAENLSESYNSQSLIRKKKGKFDSIHIGLRKEIIDLKEARQKVINQVWLETNNKSPQTDDSISIVGRIVIIFTLISLGLFGLILGIAKALMRTSSG